MTNKHFIDGILEIDYINQIARIKTFTLKRSQNNDNNTNYDIIPDIEILTGLEGFINCFNSMKVIMEKLVTEGIVKESIFDRSVINNEEYDKK